MQCNCVSLGCICIISFIFPSRKYVETISAWVFIIACWSRFLIYLLCCILEHFTQCPGGICCFRWCFVSRWRWYMFWEILLWKWPGRAAGTSSRTLQHGEHGNQNCQEMEWGYLAQTCNLFSCTWGNKVLLLNQSLWICSTTNNIQRNILQLTQF